MTTISIVTFLVCSIFLRVAAIKQDQQPGTVRRLAEKVIAFGALLCVPAIVLGLLGDNEGLSARTLDVALRLCSVGMSVLFVTTIAWMLINAAYVSFQRRQVIASSKNRSTH